MVPFKRLDRVKQEPQLKVPKSSFWESYEGVRSQLNVH